MYVQTANGKDYQHNTMQRIKISTSITWHFEPIRVGLNSFAVYNKKTLRLFYQVTNIFFVHQIMLHIINWR